MSPRPLDGRALKLNTHSTEWAHAWAASFLPTVLLCDYSWWAALEVCPHAPGPSCEKCIIHGMLYTEWYWSGSQESWVLVPTSVVRCWGLDDMRRLYEDWVVCSRGKERGGRVVHRECQTIIKLTNVSLLSVSTTRPPYFEEMLLALKSLGLCLKECILTNKYISKSMCFKLAHFCYLK